MYTNKQIWNVSYPIFLSLLAQNIINVTDTAFLGRVGEVELGASAMGGLYYICVFTIAFGFSTGSQIVMARRNGERRYSDVGPVMIQGVFFLLALAAVMFSFSRLFAKDIMRFMLSDGAGAVLLDSKPSGEINLKIEWIEICSYANELPVCMFMASELQPDGRLKNWKEFPPQEREDRAVMVGKQDIRALKKYIIKYWVNHIEECIRKHSFDPLEIDYVIPHVSSMFFYGKLNEELQKRKIDLPENKWFTNLTSVGNIGSASIFVALDELMCSGKLRKGNKILLLVPESGRFSYGTVLLTVV